MSSLQTVEIVRAANGGDGVAYLEDGVIVFVRGALVGETVDILVKQKKKTYAYADLAAIRKASPHRVAPGCAVSDRCGGCDFWHTTYANELQTKVVAALDTLRRVGRFEPPAPTIHGAPSPTQWRTRATFTTDRRKQAIGFVGRASRDVIEFEQCPILHPALNEALKTLRSCEGVYNGRVAVETDGRGGVIVEAEHASRSWVKLTIHGVVGLTGEQTVRASESHAAPLNAVVPAGRFRQGNTGMNRILVERAVSHLGDAARVLELFCGMGNFTLSYAGRCQQVEAHDVDAEAIMTLNQLAEAQNVKVEAIVSDLSDMTPSAKGFDAVLLDPPRTGALKAAESLAADQPPRIVYVSCDVATLSRDLRILLDAGYRLSALEFVDMFPRTAHIETIAVLDR